MTDLVRRLKGALDILVSVCVVVTCGVALWLALAPAKRPTEAAAAAPAASESFPDKPIEIGDSAVKGSDSAPVVVIEYSEFQCPYCKRFSDTTWRELESHHLASGRVQWVFRHFPLERIHSQAFVASEAAECAGQHGKFWEMHDRLFANQTSLDRGALESHAAIVGVEKSEFSDCLSGRMAQKIRADLASGESLGVRGTPTFFVGTRTRDGMVKVVERISGAAPLDRFESAFSKALAVASD